MKSIPSWLPKLSFGSHKPDEGKACVMEYVSLLAGEEWSDHPKCTHPVLAGIARVVNDQLSDSERHRLVPLIGRLFGTAPAGTDHEQRVLSVRLAAWCARRVLPLINEADRDAAERAILATEAWANGTGSKEAAYAVYAAAAYVANAPYSNAVIAAAFAADVAYVAAVNDAIAAAAPAEAVDLLTGLIDEYDRLTGRMKSRQLTEVELSELASRVSG